MGALKVEPLQPSELDDFIRLYWASFEPLEADMVLPMVYTGGLQPEVIQQAGDRIKRETGGNLSDFCFCARDTETDELIAVSWWAIVEHPSKTAEEIEAEYQIAHRARYGADSVSIAGMNTPLGEAFLKVLIYSEAETMQGQPYMTLRILATHPKHHRKGAGSLLLRQGLEKADRLNLPVYLDSARSGKALYERHDFVVTSDFPFDARQYGGRSEGKHWCMVRAKRHADQPPSCT